MKAPSSLFASPPGDWLVVINRLEASVFRSTASGAASQCIRTHLPEGGAGMRPPLNDPHKAGERTRSPGFFEPLAGVLHGAGRILIFGHANPFGDETGSFISWLRKRYPDVARRIVAAVPLEAQEISDAGLLAKARAFYQRTAAADPRTADLPRRVV